MERRTHLLRAAAFCMLSQYLDDDKITAAVKEVHP